MDTQTYTHTHIQTHTSTQTYPFPLSITIIHLIIKFLVAWLVRRVVAVVNKEAPNVLTWMQYLKNIAPVGEWGVAGGSLFAVSINEAL